VRGRWRELLSILADLAAVVSAGVVLVAGRGYAVGTVSRTWLAVVVVGGLLFLIVVGWLRRRAWWGKIRPKYVSSVLWVARPVQEELEARLRSEAGVRVPGELEAGVRALGGAAATLPALRVDALRVLQFALAAWDGCDAGDVRVSADQVFVGGLGWPIAVDPFGVMGQKLDQACNELVRAGMLAWYEMTVSREAADVGVRRDIAEADREGELSRLVREELRRRQTRGVATGAVAAVEEQVPSPACEAKILELSRCSVGVLEYVLRLHIDHPREVVSEDLLHPEMSTSPLKSLERDELHAALKELVDAGFLREPQWEGTELQVRVTECLADRTVARRVFEYLQSLMASEE
jgi:hypothetical protein